MSGRQLYAFYAMLQLRNNCEVDDWFDLDDIEQRVWEDMANLLCPEMSDEAKEMME